MHTLWSLYSLGMLICFATYIRLSVAGFRQSVLWGLAVMLLSPISATVFAISNWHMAKIKWTFLVYVAGLLLIIGAGIGYASLIYQPLMQLVHEAKNHKLTEEEKHYQVEYLLRNGHLPPKQEDAAQKPAQTDSDDGAGKTAENSHTEVAPQTGGKQAQPQQMATTEAADKAKPNKAKPDKATEVAANEQHDTPSIPNLNQVKPDPLAQNSKVPSDKVAVSLSRISHYLGRYFIITLKSGSEHRGILRKVGSTKLVLDRRLYSGNFVYSIYKNQIKSILMFRQVPDEP